MFAIQRHRMIFAFIALLALAALAPLRSAAAAGAERCFPETGFCISGAIRTYWERNGGLPTFGYPITAQRTETIEGSWTGPTQWFERDRLEDHANEGKGVLAGRLGASYLQLRGTPWSVGMDMPYNPECTFYTQTKRNLCGTFRAYWQNNGGLARFGYPISDPVDELIQGKTYQVQYFERRRLELHPENAGTPYEVLLGLLGREVYANVGDQSVVQLPEGDLSADVQQPILDAAYAAVRASNPKVKLAAGLVDVAGDYAVVQALPFGRPLVQVYLARRASSWQVVEATANPVASTLRQRGIPEQLLATSDASDVINLTLTQLQDPRGSGLNIYVTRPRISGNIARLSTSPSLAENLDGVSMFFKRSGSAWRFLTAGSAFPEDDLRNMGVPQPLWPYGESVRAPAS